MKKLGQILLAIGFLLIVAGLIVNFTQESTPKKQTAVILFKDDTGSIVYQQSVKIGEKAKEIKPDEKEGYDFIGWYYDTLAYDFESKVLKDITLIGRWEERLGQGDNYMVTFYNDDDTLYESQTVKPNEKAKAPTNPKSEDGGEFIGWYQGDQLFDFKIPITGNITLKAQYKVVPTPTPIEPNESEKVLEESPKIIEETDIEYNSDTVELQLEETKKVIASVIPKDATHQEIKMYCENENICTIDEEGNITGKNVGTSSIILETFHGVTKTIPVKITPKTE